METRSHTQKSAPTNSAPKSAPAASHPVISVTELNRAARELLEGSFGLITVEGELSNFACPSSGHWYFTLKDSQAQVRCALFRNRNRFLKYRPRNGDLVRLRARVSLYEGRGEFQLIGDYLEEAGTGALQQAFEQLKQRLEGEGLFDASRKRPLPRPIRQVGVVTSPTGAALQDILQVMRRRFAALPVTVYPCAVQGSEAAGQIARAIALANRHGDCDVLIVGRGGGSLEDLWPFNEEGVARAIAGSRIPVVSAVGHETDVSIADFAADLRAPTPSAAAELVTPDSSELAARVSGLQQRLVRQARGQLQRTQERLSSLQRRLKHPGRRLQEQAQRLDGLELRLRRNLARHLQRDTQRLERLVTRLHALSPQQRLAQLAGREEHARERLIRAMQHRLEKNRLRLAAAAQGLNTVSPLATLERGYAIVRHPDGSIIRDAATVTPGTRIETRLARGTLHADVVDVELIDAERIDTKPAP